MLAPSASRLVLLCLVAAIAGLALVGCGDDDDDSADAVDTTTAAEEAAPSPTDALVFDDLQANLEADGYSVEEATSEPLIRRDDGEIVQPDAKLVVSGGDLASGADVSVYSLASPEDVAAMEEFASGGDVSLVEGSLYFQSTEPGAAATIAAAAGG